MSDEQRKHPARRLLQLWPYAFVFGLVLVLGLLSFRRGVFNYGTETDFLGGYVPEARRFLSGTPLRIEFHPPLYPILLALVYLPVGDWLRAGLWISLFSALAVLLFTYAFFRRTFGQTLAAGTVLALGLSVTFLSYAMQATSDMFFFALFFAALYFAGRAADSQRPGRWLMAGAVVGLAVLTRTNGITLLALLLFGLKLHGRNLAGLKNVTWMAGGMLLPVVVWGAFAVSTGSPLFPTSNYQNLAQTYFSKSRFRGSGDALREGSEGLHSTWDVLAKDPLHIAKSYVHDLLGNIKRLFVEKNLLAAPFIYFAVPGLLLLFLRKPTPLKIYLAVVLVGTFLLLNFKAWEDRFHLYLVPFMGAGVVWGLEVLLAKFKPGRVRTLVPLLLLSLSLVLVVREVRASARRQGRDLSRDAFAAAQFIRRSEMRDVAVIARKPHLAFYCGARTLFFPNSDDLEALRHAVWDLVDGQPASGPLLLFYGFGERQFRPQLAELGTKEGPAGWLKPLVRGPESGGWALYLVDRSGLESPAEISHASKTSNL